MQAANRILALRDAIASSGDSAIRTQKRVKKYQNRCKEIVERYAKRLEEAKARENNLSGKLLATEVDRDGWVDRCREAETQTALALNRATAAEAQLIVVTHSLE